METYRTKVYLSSKFFPPDHLYSKFHFAQIRATPTSALAPKRIRVRTIIKQNRPFAAVQDYLLVPLARARKTVTCFILLFSV